MSCRHKIINLPLYLLLWRLLLIKYVQVSLAIRGGYVPDKLQTANTKTGSSDPI
jgi:hypothetical protein